MCKTLEEWTGAPRHSGCSLGCPGQARWQELVASSQGAEVPPPLQALLPLCRQDHDLRARCCGRSRTLMWCQSRDRGLESLSEDSVKHKNRVRKMIQVSLNANQTSCAPKKRGTYPPAGSPWSGLVDAHLLLLLLHPGATDHCPCSPCSARP